MNKRRLSVISAALAALMLSALIVGCSKSGDNSKESAPESTSAPTGAAVTDTSDTKADTSGAVTDESTDASTDAAGGAVTDGVTDAPNVPDEPDVPNEPDDTTTQAPPPAPAEAAVEVAGSGVTVKFEGGRTIGLGKAGDDVVPALGSYSDKLEAPSCIHPGNDVIYYYNGYTVTTSPDASGRNVVMGVEITSGSARLANGVTIGSSVSDVKSAFGSNFTETFGMMVYEIGAGKVQIVCDGGTVTALSVTIEG